MNRDWLGPPIDGRPLFALERAELLASMEPADWDRPTACPGWTVHDLVRPAFH